MKQVERNDILSRAQFELTLQISTIINEMLSNYETTFAESPTVPYTVVVSTLARTIGQVTAMFPDQDRDQLIRFAVKEMLEHDHHVFAVGSANVHQSMQFGNA